jgi:RNA polymerase sigma-70 factor (ECF subfamily)
MSHRYVPERTHADHLPAGASGSLRSLLSRYVRAWEAADIPGLVALLREDAVVAMPPGILRTGASAIGAFLASSVFRDGRRIRLVPILANGNAGFIVYSGTRADPTLRAYAV